MAVHSHLTNLGTTYTEPVSSIPGVLRHTILVTYRCSLPVLTGFSVKPLRRIETSSPLNLSTKLSICRIQASILLQRIAGYRAPLIPHLARPNFQRSFETVQWSRGGSNSRPQHCERCALPTELRPRKYQHLI